MQSRAESDAGHRADAAEQKLRAANTHVKDAEEAAAAHRQAHTDTLVANAELQVHHSTPNPYTMNLMPCLAGAAANLTQCT